MNEYLNKNVELRVIKLGNRRYYRTLVLTVGWIVLVVVAWLCIMMGGQYSFTRVPSYLPLILCVLPFFPFSASSVLFSKTFYAAVEDRSDYTQFQKLKEARVSGRPETVEALSVTFLRDDGRKFSLSFPKKADVMDGIHYEKGDRVIFVRGLKYPLELPLTDERERTCPRCGRTIGVGESRCGRCGFDLFLRT